MPRSGRCAALLLVLAAAACAEDVPVRVLTTWELEVAGEREPITLPAHVGHGLDKQSGEYRLHARVELDPAWRGHDLTLSVPLIRTFLHLRVNGREIPYLDERRFERVRVMLPHRFRIDAAETRSGVIDLELSTTTTWPAATFWDTPPRLALGPYGDRWSRTVLAWKAGTAWVSLVALLTLALIFWLRHLSAYRAAGASGVRDDRSMQFAKLAGGGALYPATQLGLLQPILGGRDVAFILVGMVIAVRASVQLSRGHLGLPPLPKWTAWGVLVLAIGMPLLAGGFLSGAWSLVLLVSLVGMLGYLVVRTWSMPVRPDRRASVVWQLTGWTIVATFSAFDFIPELGLGTPLRGLELACFALLFFVSIQALLLSIDHADMVVAQATLNEELARRVAETEVRNREINLLNEELQRKVGDRSRELSAALRKMRVAGESGLPSGAVLADRYRVVAPLGAGAMGAVYRIERLADGRSLAAKVVRGRVQAETLERFTREAELASRVDHPHVVRVYDVDVTSDGELFLVMELVEGSSLEDARARFGERAFADRVVLQMASALSAIHDRGVVHRDLKPSNVLVSDVGDPHVKIADFGIAGFGDRAQPAGPRVEVSYDIALDATGAALEATIDAQTTPAAGSAKLTQTGAIMGTPLYMAPEVLRGTATIGPASDLFSFGLIAYQVYGGPAIERSTSYFRRGTLRPFREFAPYLGAEVAAMLERCLDRDPTKRPSARELHETLAGAVSVS